MPTAKKPLSTAEGADLVNAGELCKHFPFGSVNSVGNLRRRRIIPGIRLSYRRYIYSISAVAAALARLEIKEIGRPR